jgi:hypothetical protein
MDAPKMMPTTMAVAWAKVIDCNKDALRRGVVVKGFAQSISSAQPGIKQFYSGGSLWQCQQWLASPYEYGFLASQKGHSKETNLKIDAVRTSTYSAVGKKGSFSLLNSVVKSIDEPRQIDTQPRNKSKQVIRARRNVCLFNPLSGLALGAERFYHVVQLSRLSRSGSARGMPLKELHGCSYSLAFSKVGKVPRLRRLPVLGLMLLEYNRYSPVLSFLIIASPPSDWMTTWLQLVLRKTRLQPLSFAPSPMATVRFRTPYPTIGQCKQWQLNNPGTDVAAFHQLNPSARTARFLLCTLSALPRGRRKRGLASAARQKHYSL